MILHLSIAISVDCLVMLFKRAIYLASLLKYITVWYSALYMTFVDRSQHLRTGPADINMDITDDASSQPSPAVRSGDSSGLQESHEYTRLHILHGEYTQLQPRDRPHNARELPDNVYETISGEQPREASAL